MKNYTLLLGIFLSFLCNSIQAQERIFEKEIKVAVTDTTHFDSSFIDVKTVSVDDYKGEAWRIFPNPALKEITIDAPRDWSIAYYKILDLNGKTIKQGDINFNKIDINELESGLYLVRITNGKGTLLQKRLVKQ